MNRFNILKNNKKLKQFGEDFLDWCSQSRLHALPHIVRNRANLPFLILWLLLFITCLGLCIFTITKLVAEYYEYDVISIERLNAYHELKFPIVTFCNENPFIHPNSNEYIRKHFWETYSVNVSSYSDIVDLFGVEMSYDEIRWILYKLASPLNDDSMRKQVGYTARDIFLYLSFNEIQLDPATDLDWFFDPIYGNCYRLNLTLDKVSREGYGLKAQIFTGLPNSMHTFMYEPSARGIRIEIKDHDNYPFTYQSKLAQAGMKNMFSVSKKVLDILEKPFSKCESISGEKYPLLQEMNRQSIFYGRGYCLNFFFQNWTMQNFGCYNMLYPRFKSEKFSFLQPCMNRTLFLKKFIFKEINIYRDLIESASKQCPLECQQLQYDSSNSRIKFPTRNWYEERLVYDEEYLRRVFGSEKVPSYEVARNSFAMVEIYFERIVIFKVSEHAKIEFFALLARIGGTMGLFMGASLLTYTEIFQLFLILIFSLFQRSIEENQIGNEIRNKENRPVMDRNTFKLNNNLEEINLDDLSEELS